MIAWEIKILDRFFISYTRKRFWKHFEWLPKIAFKIDFKALWTENVLFLLTVVLNFILYFWVRDYKVTNHSLKFEYQ